MKLNLSILASVAMSLLVLASCSDSGWKVSGKIEDAPADKKVAVEGFNAGIWYNIDSVAIGSDGSFVYKAGEPAPFPEIYRVSLDGKSIYFPITANDAVSITTSASAFDSDYTLSGTPTAEDMMAVDRTIIDAVTSMGAQAVLADSAFKADLNQKILADSTGIISFYIINKNIGGQPLYSPANRRDVAMLGAIAQKFADLFPNDPRTKYLEDLFIKARAGHSNATRVLNVDGQTGLLNIELFDERGNVQSLEKVAKDANLTLLSFTSYAIEPSIPYNVELNRLYEQYKSRGLQIYQIGFDSDEVAWKNTARALPWITVMNNPTDGDKLLLTYNVGAVPLTFVINADGDIVERVVDPGKLEDSVRKHLK